MQLMWKTAIKSLGTIPLLLSAALAAGELSVPSFKDIRLGVDGEVTRVVIECERSCSAAQDRQGNFLLAGVTGEFDLGFGQNDGFIARMEMQPLSGGAALRVETQSNPENVAIANCADTVICIDFTRPAVAVPTPRAQAVAQVEAETLPEIAPAPAPKKQPKRQTPPPARMISEDGPLLQNDEWQLAGALTLERIKADDLSPAACEAYQAMLQKDAWDLNAYKMLAMCAAARGDLQQAEALYQRMLKIYPDDQFAKQIASLLVALAPTNGPQVATRN